MSAVRIMAPDDLLAMLERIMAADARGAEITVRAVATADGGYVIRWGVEGVAEIECALDVAGGVAGLFEHHRVLPHVARMFREAIAAAERERGSLH